MRPLPRALLLAAFAMPAGGVMSAGCKSTITFAGSGGAGGTSTGGGASTGSGASPAAGTGGGTSTAASTGVGGGCAHVGAPCASPVDCCSGTCSAGVCNMPPCTSDNQPCTASGECCGGTCSNGACAPLDPTCKTLGNTCAASGDCCSGLCLDGLCSASSFCTQNGDVCSSPTQCCGGLCDITPGKTLGTCSQSLTMACALTDGMLCGGVFADGGVPACGGACCSRLCAPYAPTGVLVCQPASGCRKVGEACTKDGDCCGSAGLPGGSGIPVTCGITPPSAVGVCRNSMGCKPDGDICKLTAMSCNASCDCCSGNCGSADTCKLDSVGVPRCSALQCAAAGEACASSANCCGGVPCVPNPIPGATPPYICSPSACVPACGACTIDADCCPGEACVAALGSARGTCGPCNTADGGTIDDAGVCARYGQQCATSSQCCNGVPCTNPAAAPCNPGQAGCTCHFVTP